MRVLISVVILWKLCLRCIWQIQICCNDSLYDANDAFGSWFDEERKHMLWQGEAVQLNGRPH